MVDAEGVHYRVKLNKYGSKASSEEVLAASILSLIGVPHSPEVRLLVASDEAGQSTLKIASRRIEHFCDWGVFLVERGESLLQGAAREAYAAALAEFFSCENKIESLLEHHPNLRRELEQPKRAISELDGKSDTEFVKALLSFQQLRAAQNAARAKMLGLLPRSLTEGLQRAFYAAEVVGNWDFANHDLANSGWVISEEQILEGLPARVDAVSVDFGNSGMNGFKGKDKSDSVPFMREPARLDDAYFRSHAMLNAPTDSVRAGADQTVSRKWVRQSIDHAMRGQSFSKDPVLERSASFESVSRTFGAVGALPRSAVYSHLMQDVIARERESLPCVAPDPALEVAYRLYCLPKGSVAFHVKAFYGAVNTLPHPFAQQALYGVDPESMARQWESRVQAVLARASEPAIQAWCSQHPAVAQQIEGEVRRGLERFGHRAPESQPLAPRHRRASSDSLSQSSYS